MRALLLLVAILLALPASAQADRWLPGDSLRADVAVLRRAFETIHPGLYRYATPAEVAARFDALDASVAGGMSLREAYLAVAALAQTVRCGHTHVNPYNQSEALTAALVEAPRRLPFAFRWLDKQMVVTRDLSGGAGLARGTVVVALDGVPAADVLARLLPYSRTDGANEAKRVANLEVDGGSRYHAFDVWYGLVYRPDATVRLTVREPGGNGVRDVTVATMTHAERAAVRAADRAAVPSAAGAARLGWAMTLDPDGTAVLAMRSWATYNSDWDWQAWVDSTFDALVAHGARRLVLDLRGNEGGTGVGDAILARLVDRDLPLAAFERWVRYRTIPDDLRPVLDTWDRSFDDWSAYTTVERDGFFRMTRWDDGPEGTVIRARGPRFAGPVAVLVEATNSSATFEFAQEVQRHRLGTLVGSPTGGNQRGINGGAYYFLRLPHSGIEVDLPLIGFFPPDGADAHPDAGLTPDVDVRPTAADIAQGGDPVLGAARRVGHPSPGGGR